MLRLQTRLRYEAFAINLGYNTESLSEQYAGCWLYFRTGQKGCSIIKELRYQSIINTPYYALAGGFEFLSLIIESSWNYSDIRAVHKIDLYIPLMNNHLKTAQFNINKILALPSLSQSFLNIADIKVINQELIGILLTSTAQQNAIKISVISPSIITLDSYQYQIISNPQNISYNTFYTKTVTYLDNLSVEKKRFKHNLLYNYIKGGKKYA